MMPSIFSARPLSDQVGNSWVPVDFAPEYFNNNNAKAINYGNGSYVIGGLLSPTSTDTYKISTDNGNTWVGRTQSELFGSGSVGQSWMITGIASSRFLTKIIVGSWNGSSSVCRVSTNNGLSYTEGESIKILPSIPNVKTLILYYGSSIYEFMFAYGSGTNKISYSTNGGLQWTDLGDVVPSGITVASVNDIAAPSTLNSTYVIAVTNQTTNINNYKVYSCTLLTGQVGVWQEIPVQDWPVNLNEAFVQIAYGNSTFVAITPSGYVSYKTASVGSFTVPTRYFTDVSSSYPVRLLFFGQRFYVVYKRVGVNAGIYFRQSTDGVKWTNATIITLGGMNTLWPLLVDTSSSAVVSSSSSVVCAGHSSLTYSLSTS